jgi:TonB family protein
MRRSRIPGLVPALLLCLAARAGAQTRGAVETKHVDPVYPDNLLKTEQQGNVILFGRIDASGRVDDLIVFATSHRDFSAPAIAAVRQWQFRPAMKDGKPIEIFANVGVRFRIQNDKRGQIPEPILGDIAISPADASGKATAPEGFPIQKGKDPALRAEVLLDVSPQPEARTLGVTVEARSPSGKRLPVFQPPVAVAAGAAQVKFPVVVHIGDDWPEGAWILHLTVNGKNAGGGQFWFARDPAHFQFTAPKS